MGHMPRIPEEEPHVDQHQAQNQGVPTVITDLNGQKRIVYVQQAQNLHKKAAPGQTISGQQAGFRDSAHHAGFRDSAHYTNPVQPGQQYLSPEEAQQFVKRM